ncbi:hypothetical protein B0H10DRAFT_1939570 [Mycena sp. CBHHK59/15]|nr:hypothetical protein B0H10DRAFT_1939570 [Mycena sp. CBHHK59/15]
MDMHNLNARARADGFDSPEATIQWHVETGMLRGPGWFTGLSGAFLAPRTARLLLLAGTDRLDRELMIVADVGQVPHARRQLGHVLYEGVDAWQDDPKHVTEILLDFWRRNDRILPFKGIKVREEE